MATTEKTQAQMEGLATLLVLNDEIRKVTNIREFGFFTTNETHRLIPYHMAFLWRKREHIGIELLTQSGVPEIDRHAVANHWIRDKISQLSSMPLAKKIHPMALSELDKHPEESAHATNWTDVFPNDLLWCPLVNKSDELSGGIIFLREYPFTDPEIKMIGWLIASYQYTWSSFIKHNNINLIKIVKKKPFLIFIGLVLLFPIHLSVLGNATVVPNDPILINAPMEGVIKSFSVSPGQSVTAGQLLFTLDKTDLASNVEVSKKEQQLTQAKLRTAINQGLDNEQISAEIPILKAQLAIDSAHISYTNAMLDKTNVTSPISGVVIFDSKEDWVGQPVQAGERILVVTDPKKVELKIMIPITNIIDLKVGNEGDFFEYGNLKAITVTITTLGYNAKLTPSRILSYELRANFTGQKDMPQLGSQGTVRLYGQRVPLIYYLLRRPLQAMRQLFGI